MNHQPIAICCKKSHQHYTQTRANNFTQTAEPKLLPSAATKVITSSSTTSETMTMLTSATTGATTLPSTTAEPTTLLETTTAIDVGPKSVYKTKRPMIFSGFGCRTRNGVISCLFVSTEKNISQSVVQTYF